MLPHQAHVARPYDEPLSYPDESSQPKSPPPEPEEGLRPPGAEFNPDAPTSTLPFGASPLPHASWMGEEGSWQGEGGSTNLGSSTFRGGDSSYYGDGSACGYSRYATNIARAI